MEMIEFYLTKFFFTITVMIYTQCSDFFMWNIRFYPFYLALIFFVNYWSKSRLFWCTVRSLQWMRFLRLTATARIASFLLNSSDAADKVDHYQFSMKGAKNDNARWPRALLLEIYLLEIIYINLSRVINNNADNNTHDLCEFKISKYIYVYFWRIVH